MIFRLTKRKHHAARKTIVAEWSEEDVFPSDARRLRRVVALDSGTGYGHMVATLTDRVNIRVTIL